MNTRWMKTNGRMTVWFGNQATADRYADLFEEAVPDNTDDNACRLCAGSGLDKRQDTTGLTKLCLRCGGTGKINNVYGAKRIIASMTPKAKADPAPVAPPAPVEPSTERLIVGGGEE